ncbi:MAG: hypothetical protein IJ646_05285 [Clostridia bacterium]|nr:hypothetical protein [Clostridia bacterium]
MKDRCGTRRRRTNPAKVAGVVLMVAGGLMLLIFVPRWVWMGALSILCVSVGFLLWRFSE